MLTRWNPFNELWGVDDSGYSSQLGLACDVFDDENAVVLKAEMPGMKPEDVKVDVHGNTLTISGQRSLEQEKNVRGYRHIERRYGSFSRSFSLPDTIDADSIEATLDAGILTVRLPKSARARPRSISVGSGTSRKEPVHTGSATGQTGQAASSQTESNPAPGSREQSRNGPQRSV